MVRLTPTLDEIETEDWYKPVDSYWKFLISSLHSIHSSPSAELIFRLPSFPGQWPPYRSVPCRPDGLQQRQGGTIGEHHPPGSHPSILVNKIHGFDLKTDWHDAIIYYCHIYDLFSSTLHARRVKCHVINMSKWDWFYPFFSRKMSSQLNMKGQKWLKCLD